MCQNSTLTNTSGFLTRQRAVRSKLCHVEIGMIRHTHPPSHTIRSVNTLIKTAKVEICQGPPIKKGSTLVNHIQAVTPSASHSTDHLTPPPPLASDNLSCLSKLVCPLCLELILQPTELSCSVLACARCVIAWLTISGGVSCPCCYLQEPMSPS